MVLPHRFGRYVLLSKIARGGMAEVFHAKYLGENGFSKDVAVKRLLPEWRDHPEFTRMLVGEAKALVRLTHSRIVQVFELGRDGNHLFISMEWIDGVNLKELAAAVAEAGEKLPSGLAVRIIQDVLLALECAHQKGIVHRDVSPQNILLSFEGEVKLTDFGIAKGVHRQWETTQARVKGKFGYMSPEQARGEAVTAASDLFSAGVVLFELLAGRKLFEGRNDLAVLEKIKEARWNAGFFGEVSPVLGPILEGLLKKAPAERFASAGDVLETLRRIRGVDFEKSDASSLALLLKKYFPGGRRSPFFQKRGNRTAEGFPLPGIRIRHRGLRFAGALLAFFFLTGGLIRLREPLTREAHAEEIPSAPALPEVTGSVTVHSVPRPVHGKLILEGKNIELKTPFFLGDIDLREEKRGEIVLDAGEGKTVGESFFLSKGHPHWAKNFSVPEIRPGFLRVQARPWGNVSLEGVFPERETPLEGVPLKTGEYDLQIAYPPKGEALRKKIRIASGKTVSCVADFTSIPSVACD